MDFDLHSMSFYAVHTHFSSTLCHRKAISPEPPNEDDSRLGLRFACKNFFPLIFLVRQNESLGNGIYGN